jgi:hypothetical protein
MTRFEWDGLRRGDAIFVHHSPGTQHRAAPATVAFVNVRAARGNEVGLRMADGTVVWPSWLAAHTEPVQAADACWRCGTPEPSAP